MFQFFSIGVKIWLVLVGNGISTELKDDRMENGIIGRRIVHNLR